MLRSCFEAKPLLQLRRVRTEHSGCQDGHSQHAGFEVADGAAARINYGMALGFQDEQETCARDMIYPDRVGPSKDLPISVMSPIGMATVVDGTHPA